MEAFAPPGMNVARHQYRSDNVLQDVYICRPPGPNDIQSSTGYWVVYIHGGAWRDPEILAPSFNVTEAIHHGLDKNINVDGYASINYRLTAHPDHPQVEEALSNYQGHASNAYTLRNATHPDHLHDVRAALCFLQSHYGIGNRYVLVGHSCGATLAFQAISKLDCPVETMQAIPRPIAIVGVAGIYDLRLLRDTHAQSRYAHVYQRFITDAFGTSDESIWDAVSPVNILSNGVLDPTSTGTGSNSRRRPRLIVLAHSTGDELVDTPQVEAMKSAVTSSGWMERERGELMVLDDLHDSHDDIWRQGRELAGVISRTVEQVKAIQKNDIDMKCLYPSEVDPEDYIRF